jgi:ATP-dependent Clp protease adaptor protein ClpS
MLPSTPQREKRRQTSNQKLPPYAVILHNDDINTFEFVVGVLIKIFKFDINKAIQLTMEAHHTGRSIVWSGSLEVAELKADQIRSCGADPIMKEKGAQPLGVSVEAQ